VECKFRWGVYIHCHATCGFCVSLPVQHCDFAKQAVVCLLNLCVVSASYFGNPPLQVRLSHHSERIHYSEILCPDFKIYFSPNFII
jgi:hypothetical protein